MASLRPSWSWKGDEKCGNLGRCEGWSAGVWGGTSFVQMSSRISGAIYADIIDYRLLYIGCILTCGGYSDSPDEPDHDRGGSHMITRALRCQHWPPPRQLPWTTPRCRSPLPTTLVSDNCSVFIFNTVGK